MRIPPATFEQSQLKFFGDYLVAAGIMTGLGAALIVAILTWGGWPADRYEQIIGILGRALMGAGIIMISALALMGLGGPARLMKATFGRFALETEGD